MDINNSKNSFPSILNEFNQDDIPRCLNCNLIASLKLIYIKNKPIIFYSCQNNHKGKINLKDYMNNYNKFSLLKEKCYKCGKTQKEIKGFFYYCCECSKFLCNTCQIIHYINHNIIDIKKYDSICKIHFNTFYLYCLNCKKNLCNFCRNEHKLHNLIDLIDYNFTKELKFKLKTEINKLEKLISNFKILKKDIISLIDKLIESSELEIKLIKLLFSTYKYEENIKSLNYNIIHNLKNFENKFEIYERINQKSKKYISFLENSQITNCFKNNFKQLKKHSNVINYLSKLKDGRLISCSDDCTINIYKRVTFDLQFSIKKHSNWVLSFTQLNDGRIITCSNDQSINVIKLINEEQYQIEEILLENKGIICKVIEIRNNELISISSDKTFKVWMIKKENKFENILNIIFQESNSYCNILKLNKNEFVTLSTDDRLIKFWNSNNYTIITKINDIETTWTCGNMCLLDDDILCIGGDNYKGIYLIKISIHQIINNITGIKTIYSIFKCEDFLFLCSIIDIDGNNCLVKYKYEKNELIKVIEKKNAHKNYIYSCVELDDGIIASGGEDGLIKLWKEY